MIGTKKRTKKRPQKHAKKTTVHSHLRQATKSLRLLASVSELSLADQEAIAELLASAQRLSRRLRQSTTKSRGGKVAAATTASRKKTSPKSRRAGAAKKVVKRK